MKSDFITSEKLEGTYRVLPRNFELMPRTLITIKEEFDRLLEKGGYLGPAVSFQEKSLLDTYEYNEYPTNGGILTGKVVGDISHKKIKTNIKGYSGWETFDAEFITASAGVCKICVYKAIAYYEDVGGDDHYVYIIGFSEDKLPLEIRKVYNNLPRGFIKYPLTRTTIYCSPDREEWSQLQKELGWTRDIIKRKKEKGY